MGEIFVFEMRYAIQGHSAPCEGPDLTNEGFILQYSLNNSTWVNIDYWPPLNGGSSSFSNDSMGS